MAAAVTCAGGGCTLISRGEIFAEQAGHAIIDGVFAAMSAPRQRNKGKEKEDKVRGRNGGRGVRLKKKAFRHARQQKCAHACECQQLLCRANGNIFLFPSLCIYMCVCCKEGGTSSMSMSLIGMGFLQIEQSHLRSSSTRTRTQAPPPPPPPQAHQKPKSLPIQLLLCGDLIQLPLPLVLEKLVQEPDNSKCTSPNLFSAQRKREREPTSRSPPPASVSGYVSLPPPLLRVAGLDPVLSAPALASRCREKSERTNKLCKNSLSRERYSLDRFEVQKIVLAGTYLLRRLHERGRWRRRRRWIERILFLCRRFAVRSVEYERILDFHWIAGQSQTLVSN